MSEVDDLKIQVGEFARHLTEARSEIENRKRDTQHVLDTCVPVHELTELQAQVAAEARAGSEWECGCGSWSGVNLANCGVCHRLRSESQIREGRGASHE